MRILWMIGLIVAGCQTSLPSEQLLTRCEREPRWGWQPDYRSYATTCTPLPEEMIETPRQVTQYHLQCPNHPNFCYRKAEMMCGGSYALLRTRPFAQPGELVIECR